MGSVHILCVNINFIVDTILKFDVDANADAKVDVDVKCERILTYKNSSLL